MLKALTLLKQQITLVLLQFTTAFVRFKYQIMIWLIELKNPPDIYYGTKVYISRTINL